MLGLTVAKVPKGMQGKAKLGIHQTYIAHSKELALKAYQHFAEMYRGCTFCFWSLIAT